jgi:Zn-dependent M28 family amino/carboxypeptidase
VAALLELARVLAPHRFRRSLILAALDMEEIGLLGARALAPELVKELKLAGVIVFETMAYSSREPNSQIVPPGLGALYPGLMKRIRTRQAVGDWTAVIYRGPSTELARRFAEGLVHLAGRDACIALRDPADLPLVGGVLKRVVPAVHNFARSDHVPFWEAGVSAIQITDTANLRNPHYHRPTDTPETLDYQRLAAIVGATAVALHQVAGLAA